MSNYQSIPSIGKFSVRIYYEDTDAGGIVYHANYLKFAERARCEWLREWNIPAVTMLPDHGFQIVVRHLTADYFASSYLDDLLDVETSIVDLGNASFTMQQRIMKGETLLADLKVVLVCVNKAGKAIRVPDILRNKIEPTT